MRVGLYTEATLPNDIHIDNYYTPSIIETALTESASIVHDPLAMTRTERFGFDSNIRRRYEKRPREAEDSLNTIRTYNYIDPSTVVMENIPASYGSDKKVTDETIKKLLQKGVHPSWIETIPHHKQAVVTHYETLYQMALSQLKDDEKTDTIKVEALRKQYCDFTVFPFILMGKDEEHSPSLRVTRDDVNNTYYALSTSVPQNVSDIMTKTYISLCVHYMLGKMGEDYGLIEIGLDTDVYYDYLTTENATLYLFLHLTRF